MEACLKGNMFFLFHLISLHVIQRGTLGMVQVKALSRYLSPCTRLISDVLLPGTDSTLVNISRQRLLRWLTFHQTPYRAS